MAPTRTTDRRRSEDADVHRSCLTCILGKPLITLVVPHDARGTSADYDRPHLFWLPPSLVGRETRCRFSKKNFLTGMISWTTTPRIGLRDRCVGSQRGGRKRRRRDCRRRSFTRGIPSRAHRRCYQPPTPFDDCQNDGASGRERVAGHVLRWDRLYCLDEGASNLVELGFG